MIRSAIDVVRRRFPWLLLPFARRRWQSRIDAAIRSGAFILEPQEVSYWKDYERASADRKIPRIFHQTWRDTNIPSFFKDFHKQLIDLHPSPLWEHRFWDDEAIAKFVQECFPQYWEAFQLLPKPIMRVDMFRYMLLFVHGGVYSDLDFQMYKPIDDMIADCTLLLPAETDDASQESFLAQHFLASCPGHVFWQDCIEACLAHPREKILAYDDPLTATGPVFVSRVWRANPDKYRAKIPMRVYLAPPSEYLLCGKEIPERSYGLHACTGTWR